MKNGQFTRNLENKNEKKKQSCGNRLKELHMR